MHPGPALPIQPIDARFQDKMIVFNGKVRMVAGHLARRLPGSCSTYARELGREGKPRPLTNRESAQRSATQGDRCCGTEALRWALLTIRRGQLARRSTRRP